MTTSNMHSSRIQTMLMQTNIDTIVSTQESFAMLVMSSAANYFIKCLYVCCAHLRSLLSLFVVLARFCFFIKYVYVVRCLFLALDLAAFARFSYDRPRTSSQLLPARSPSPLHFTRASLSTASVFEIYIHATIQTVEELDLR